MNNKIVGVLGIWAAIIVAYLIMGASMSAINEIISTANTSIAASANMSNMPGTQEAVRMAPVWMWFIPGTVGIVLTVINLKRA